MKTTVHLLIGLLLLTLNGCSVSASRPKPKPEWINNRPVNNSYYIGIGTASKASAPNDYQQVAKKNALNDLISEIKVTVSANSVLSQYQNNQAFSQQFESETKISALNTIEQYESVDNWENKETYWVYYRLSKAEYEAARRRKMNNAIDRAEDYFTRAEQFDHRSGYMQSLRMKVRALSAVQDYLNEDLQTVRNGRSVLLVNELMTSVQNQLYRIAVFSKKNELKGKAGKPVSESFDLVVQLKSDEALTIPFVPLKMKTEQGKMEYGEKTETDQHGIATYHITRIASKDPVQLLRVSADMEQVLKNDSVNNTLRQLILSLDVPSTAIRVLVEPLRMHFDGQEQNLSGKQEINILEPVLKNALINDGCNFTETAGEADYLIQLRANTRALGAIYGTMQGAALDMSISVTDSKTHQEIYRESLQNIKGFQTTPETAGKDAYKTASEQLMNTIYPGLRRELFSR